jgi:threonine dehydrogenase-like Zn-dependent dehydrogenase
MRSLTFVAPGRLAWTEIAPPLLVEPTDALVRPIAAARCDLDAAILRGEAPFRGRALHWLRNHLPEGLGQQRMFRNAPFKGPYAFGHECVAEVVEVGTAVRGVRPGERVIVPFQISCGTCARCSAGLTGSCTGVPPRSMYGFGDLGGHTWGGVMSDLVRVPFADAMLVALPAGVDPLPFASASDNIADAWRTVAGPLSRAPGAPILVQGGGAASIGLYAAGIAVALGAARVDYVDPDPGRRGVAEALGANAHATTPRARYPITVDASAETARLVAALRATEPGGTCTSVGIYYQNLVALPLLEMYGTGVAFVTGRVSARAVLPDVLALIASGRFHPERVTTRTADWEDAPRALLDAGPKVVVHRA